MEQLRNWVNQTNVHRHKRDNKTSEWADSLLWKPIIYKYILKTTISKFQQQKLNDETVTLPNLRILSMPIKKKKQYCARLHLIRIGRTHIGYQFWSFFVSTHDFFVGKKMWRLTLVAIKLHIHEVSMGKKYGNGFLFALITRGCLWLGNNVSKRSKLRPRIASVSRMRKGDLLCLATS